MVVSVQPFRACIDYGPIFDASEALIAVTITGPDRTLETCVLGVFRYVECRALMCI